MPEGDSLDRIAMPGVPERKGVSRRVEDRVAVRAPHLHDSLRCFCLGAFKALGAELEAGAELPFAFEEHASRGGPALYEYRPLVRGFVEERSEKLRSLSDTRLAL